MKEKIDFYEYGKHIAAEGIASFISLAEQIGEQYGKKARSDFELGIASSIPQYGEESYIEDVRELLNEEGTIGGMTDYGDPRVRNNSYFGGTGVEKILDENGFFKEPHVRNKK